MSISTISHHLRSVEESLGVQLVDHSKRPMALTPAGNMFARYVDEGLGIIRQGETALLSGDIAQVRELRLGLVDDLDGEVALELTQRLSQTMPKCTFKHILRPSHEIIRLLQEKKLDVGVATQPITEVPGLVEYPILRDPFIFALPANATETPEELLSSRARLPFLRYSEHLIIGNLIELHLRRMRVSLENRLEMESNHSLLGMVAEGTGWTITTPASFNKSKQFQSRIALYPFTNKRFSRRLSLYSNEYYPAATTEFVAEILRQLIDRHSVNPVVLKYPWLANDFRVLSNG